MTPLTLAEPDRPFWGFAEVFLVLAIFLAGGATVVGVAVHYLHAPEESGLWSVLEEATAYALVFIGMKFMFLRYGKGMLESLGWTKLGPFKPLHLAATGLGLVVIVTILEYALRTPDVETPFTRLLEDPASRIAIALFAVTVGPMVEELLFRGFLQPVLIGVWGVLPGILVTSALFGAAHLIQNANMWQSGVLIMFVGFVLGTVRHLTGSTKASTIVHIAYNSLPFLGLLVSGNPVVGK